MHAKPFLSIITPVFNAEATLFKTISSIKNQEFDDLEYIIIDSNSKDNTSEIIRNHSSIIDKYIVEEDNGIYDAMNKGIRLARGELIGIINADDQYNLGSFKAVYNAFKENDRETIFFSDLIVSDGIDSITMQSENSLSSLLLGTASIAHPTMFVPREIYLKYGAFNLEFDTYGADRELILRFKMNRIKFCKLKHKLSIFNFGGATSRYDLRNIIKQTKQEFNLLKSHLPLLITIKTTLKFFSRLIRNYFLSMIIPKKKFLKIRLNKLNKNKNLS